MTDRWGRIKEIFQAALELSERERAAYVEKACAGDDLMAREVLEMLREENRPDSFLEPEPADTVPSAGGGVPQRLGDFELLEMIGQGGMGTVYKARQASLDRIVALKVLFKGGPSPLPVERFRREAKAVARLNHPGIVSILFVGEDQGVNFFAMELVPGRNLAKEIREIRGRVSLDENSRSLLDSREASYFRSVARLTRDVADALAYAHTSGIVHRDVKPHNILVTQELKTVLVDFGLARDERFGAITRTGDVGGTPFYMSPEQVKSARHTIDHRTDIYSLGVVLFELLTLRRPFDGRTSHEVFQQIMQRDVPRIRRINPRVPRDLEMICLKAMAKSPAQRYETAAALRDDLDAFLGHQAIRARPPTISQVAGRFVSRHHRTFGVAAVALIALTIGIFVERRVEARERLAPLQEALRPVAEAASPAEVPFETLDAGRRALADPRLVEYASGSDLVALVDRTRAQLEKVKQAWVDDAKTNLAIAQNTRDSPMIRDARLLAGLQKLFDVSLLFPQEKDLRRLATQAAYPKLTVRALAVNGELAAATAVLRPMDLFGSGVAKDTALGETPIEARPVPQGIYRVLIRFRGGQSREIFCQVEPGGEKKIEVRLRDDEDHVTDDMVRFERCDFTFLKSEGNPQSDQITHIEPFYLDRYEVSNRQYKEFLAAHPEMPRPKYWEHGYQDSYDSFPVVGITWQDMESYAAWRGKRLPTLAEWQRAAAGLERRQFPYVSLGLDDHRGNVHVLRRKESIPDPEVWAYHLAAVKPVDSFPEAATPEGIFNLYGNVEEYTESIPVTDAGGVLVPREWDRWIVGGACDALDRRRPIAVMGFTGIGRDDASELLGFRCAKSAD